MRGAMLCCSLKAAKVYFCAKSQEGLFAQCIIYRDTRYYPDPARWWYDVGPGGTHSRDLTVQEDKHVLGFTLALPRRFPRRVRRRCSYRWLRQEDRRATARAASARTSARASHGNLAG